MSESESEGGNNRRRDASGPGNREVAHRLFAAEYDDATYSYSESNEERAPNYVVTPTGARVNRLFVVGVLTEVGQAGDSMLRARVVDPTGAFVVYAGQYQPDAMAFLDDTEPPTFVAVTGKAQTFKPDDSERVFTSIRPENISEVDGETRDRWVITTAERTLERVATVALARDTGYSGDELRDTLREGGVDPSFAAGIPIALEEYGTRRPYLADVQRLALDATRLVAGEIDTVDDLVQTPGSSDGTGSIEPAIDELSISINPDVDTTDTPESSSPSSSSTTPSSEQATPTPSADEKTATTETDSEPVTTARDEIPTDRSEHTRTESVDEISDDFDPEEFELDEEVRQEVESEYGTEFSTAAEVDSAEEASIETDDSAPETSSETERQAESSFDDVTDSDEEVSAQSTFTAETTTEPETDSAVSATESEPEREEPPVVGGRDTATDDTSAETGSDTEPGSGSGSGSDSESESESEIDERAETVDEDADLDTVLLETMRDLNEGDGADRDILIERVSEAMGVSDGVVEDAVQEALMSGQCYEPNDDRLKPI